MKLNTASLILVLLCVVSLGASAQTIDSGLKAYWAMDGDYLDQTINSIDGTPVNSPVFAPGIIGQALSFTDKNQHVLLNAGTLPAPWTASFWVKRHTGTTTHASLFGGNGILLRLEQHNSAKKVGLTELNAGNKAYDYTAPLDEWVNLIFSSDATGTHLYADALYIGTLTNTPLDMLAIGREDKAGSAVAELDEIAIWSRALNAAEAAEVVQRGLLGLTLDAAAGHLPPLALKDEYIILPAHFTNGLTVAVTNGVLANDTAFNGGALTAQQITGPAHGTLSFGTNGSFTYTPDNTFTDPDQFTYQVSDGVTNSEIVTVYIVADASLVLPETQDDRYNVYDQDLAVGFLNIPADRGVIVNDQYTNAATLSLSIDTAPAHGSVVLANDGSFVYTPDGSFTTGDSFTYQLDDGIFITAPTTVTLARNALNTFYISPAGDDSNAGTKAAPWQTITNAQAQVRSMITNGLTGDVIVYLREGRYELENTVDFTSADSDGEFRITWAGYGEEEAIISGGREITGWQEGPDGIWTVHLPEVQAGHLYFRQMHVNGVRADVARYPNKYDGTGDRNDSVLNCWTEYTPKNSDDYYCWVTDNDGVVNRADSWTGWTNINIVIMRVWCGHYKYLKSFDPETRGFLLEGPHSQTEHFIENHNPKKCWFENSIDFLDAPGEFFVDKDTGLCHYVPRPGQSIANAEVFAPVMDGSLFNLNGPIENLHFHNLTFSDLDFYLPRPPEDSYSGIAGGQGATDWKGGRQLSALQGSGFNNGSVTDCRFVRLRHSGIDLWSGGSGSDNVLVSGCEFGDLGGNGIQAWTGYSDNFMIYNNYIHHIGQIWLGAHPLCIYTATGGTIEHNEMFHLSYGGTSVGWWGSGVSNLKLNYNEIHDFCKMVHDTGGMYSLGYCGGTQYNHNHIHDADRPLNGGGAYTFFFDNESSYLEMDGNIGYGVGATVVFQANGAISAHPSTMRWEGGYPDYSSDTKDFGNSILIGGASSTASTEQKDTDAYRYAGLTPQWRHLRETEVESSAILNWDPIITDTFESGLGNWIAGGTNALLYSGSTHAHEGTSAAQLRGSGTNSMLTQTATVNLSAQDSVRIAFWYKAVGLHEGESFSVSFDDGSAWQTVATYTKGQDFLDDTFRYAQIVIPATHFSPSALPAAGRFRFECNAGDNDSIYLDEVTVGIPNVAPVAVADSYEILAGASSFDVAAPGILANDTDNEGDTMTAELVSDVSIGVLNLAPDGSFSYAPPSNFTGQVSFAYRANDAIGKGSVSGVTILVTPSTSLELLVEPNFLNGQYMHAESPYSGWKETIKSSDSRMDLQVYNQLGGAGTMADFSLSTKTPAVVAVEVGLAPDKAILRNIEFDMDQWRISYGGWIAADRFGGGSSTGKVSFIYHLDVSTAAGTYRYQTTGTIDETTSSSAHLADLKTNRAWISSGGYLGSLERAKVKLSDVISITFRGEATVEEAPSNTGKSRYEFREGHIRMDLVSILGPPIADAGGDRTVGDSDRLPGEPVTLDGSASIDYDGFITNYVWTEGGSILATGTNQTVSLSDGPHMIDLVVTDNEGNMGTNSARISVSVYTNQVPVADAGGIRTVFDSDGLPGESVLLDGSGSTDSDGIITNYIWKQGGSVIANSSTHVLWLPDSSHIFDLIVTDDVGASATNQSFIRVLEYDVLFFDDFEEGDFAGYTPASPDTPWERSSSTRVDMVPRSTFSKKAVRMRRSQTFKVPFSTAGAKNIRLRYDRFITADSDGAATTQGTDLDVQWSLDGTNWTTLLNENVGKGKSLGWAEKTLDLPANVENQTAIYIQFKTTVGANSNYEQARIDNVMVTGVRDSDGDGLPDVWENIHGMNPVNSADAALDMDGDGMSNGDEFIAGMNPADEYSLFAISGEASSNQTILLYWPSASNRYYDILQSGNLIDWVTTASNIPATPPENQFGPTASTNKAVFYKVNVELR